MAHTQQTFNINQGQKLLGGKNDYKSMQISEQDRISFASKQTIKNYVENTLVYSKNKNEDRRSNVNLNVVRGLPNIKAGITTLHKDGYKTLDCKTSRKEFSQGRDPFGHKGSIESHSATSH